MRGRSRDGRWSSVGLARAGRTQLAFLALPLAVFACTVALVTPVPQVRGPAHRGSVAPRVVARRREGPSRCGTEIPTATWLGKRLGRYALTYCTRFSGRSLPRGWYAFSGIPSGDPAGHFLPSHVHVRHGVLTLTASRDRRLHGHWATGGVCLCGAPRTYGAFFVHSRVTGPGPDEIDLLWPVAHVWPPEIDFNESVSHADSTTWSVHFGSANHVVDGMTRIDLEAWHTWGVVWTSRSVSLLVDGRTWGVVTSRRDIPTQPMTLDISQQTFCGLSPACPRRTVAMEVSWIAEYSAARPAG